MADANSTEPHTPSWAQGRDRLRLAVEAMADAAWHEPGFCVPNPTTYPHQWLWDSCFHSLVWCALGNRERAWNELRSALATIGPTGFVPHMNYWSEPEASQDLWARSGTSSITQPPMVGHAIAVLAADGIDEEIVGRAAAMLRGLYARKRTPSGLVPVFHPWETGCDDSPRWDRWRSDPSDVAGWREQKVRLVRSLVFDDAQTPIANPDFTVGSVGFNALLAWNTLQLCSVIPDSALESSAHQLVGALQARWDSTLETWVDDLPEPDGDGVASAGARTLDALLCSLVDPRDEAFSQLMDPTQFGAPYGPSGVHRDEPTYQPDRYWRGPAWPQLTYLLAVAAAAAGQGRVAAGLEQRLVAGAERSGLAEYWHPDTGAGLGARPQTWSGLALVPVTTGSNNVVL